MEKKKLEQKLNNLYKEKKKKVKLVRNMEIETEPNSLLVHSDIHFDAKNIFV
jgi:hypothetical protein